MRILALAALAAVLLLPRAGALSVEDATATAPVGAEAAYGFTAPPGTQVYAKLLALPGNPILDAAGANGTVAADRSHGLSGWWATLAIEVPGQPPHPLGAYADGSPTPAVTVPEEGRGRLLVRIHAPPGAFATVDQRVVHLALAQRTPHQATASGGSIDPSQGLQATVRAAAPAASPTGPAEPSLAGPAALVAALATAAAGGLAAWRQRHA